MREARQACLASVTLAQLRLLKMRLWYESHPDTVHTAHLFWLNRRNRGWYPCQTFRLDTPKWCVMHKFLGLHTDVRTFVCSVCVLGVAAERAQCDG